MEKKSNKSIAKWVYWCIVAIVFVVIYKVFENTTQIKEGISNFVQVLKPFLMGILISYLLYIPCKQIEKLYKSRKIKFVERRARGLSVLTVYILAVILIVIIVNFVLPPLIKSGVEFSNNIGEYYDEIIDKLVQMKSESGLQSEIANNLIEETKNINIKEFINIDNITQYAKNLLNFAKGIFNIFIAIVVSIYILLERSEILKFFGNLSKAILKPNAYKSVKRYFFKSNEIFFKFVSSQLLAAMIVGILATIIMLIVRVKYGILLGLFIGLFNLIPYFGAIIAVGISILITLATGGVSQTIVMAILILIVQQLDANITGPKIVGNSLKISPLLVIFAVTMGGAYFGFLGMFLAVPIAAVLKLAIDEYVEFKLEK
ncbi:MAG: AI-2E family transporter [Clostridia bacterium]|nr:AI-2E family transporter [Clostridia bacterium]